MKRIEVRALVLFFLNCAFALSGVWANDKPQSSLLRGVVASNAGGMKGAIVCARDVDGLASCSTTDDLGHYQLDATGWTAPVAVAAHAAGNGNCLRNDQPRARCLVALRQSLGTGVNTTNVNALTDWLASDVALALGYRGPQQMAEANPRSFISAARYAWAMQQLHAGFGQALVEAGIQLSPNYDPTTAVMEADGHGLDALLRVLNHNRGYDNNTGEASATVITDPLWQPIAKPFGPQDNAALQLGVAQAALRDIEHAGIRVFVVGDSTAATYERQRLPRMGWGQVLEV